MEITNQDVYNDRVESNNDAYGKGIIRYATNWANMMESKINNGEKLEDIARRTGFDSDDEGVTGYMYGCAVGFLAECWKYGDQLRRWHNIDTQIGTEGEKANESGGVLNPALMVINTKP